MPRRNCHCGLLPVANCVRCGNGSCAPHLEALQRRAQLNFGYGTTFGEAALMRGYVEEPWGTFVCHDCRLEDGHDYVGQISRETSSWGTDPLLWAFNSIRRGVVYEEHRYTFWKLVDRWLSAAVPPGNVGIRYLSKPARNPVWTPFGRTPYRPAEYGSKSVRGWEFPQTFITIGHYETGPMMGCRYESRNGCVTISADGEAWFDSNPASRDRDFGDGIDLVQHVLVEMARRSAAHRGDPWEGPGRPWEMPRFKTTDPL